MSFMLSTRKIVLIALLVQLAMNAQICQAGRAIIEDIIVRPVLVILVDSSSGKGSGFYYRDSKKGIFLVSACHVFMEKDRNNNVVLRSKKAHLLSYPKDLDWSKPAKLEIDLDSLFKQNLIRFDSNNDTFAMQISKEVQLDDGERTMKINDGIKRLLKGRILTIPADQARMYKDVLIGNDVYISGFPSSLGLKRMPQIDYDRPLLRKGIISGKYDNRKTIIIDCPVFGGNSGGPVIELEDLSITNQKFYVIGIISQFVPFIEEWINPQHRLKNVEFENSGYSVVVPIDKVVELIEQF